MMQAKATAKNFGKKLLRPIWARVWARIERRIQAREVDLLGSLWDNMDQLQAQVQGVIERLRSEAMRLQVFEENVPQLADQLKSEFSTRIAELQGESSGLRSIEQLRTELSAKIDELSKRIEDDTRQVHLVRERVEFIRREFMSELRSAPVEDRASERPGD
jgi:chromosome segregation ATPase